MVHKWGVQVRIDKLNEVHVKKGMARDSKSSLRKVSAAEYVNSILLDYFVSCQPTKYPKFK